MTRERQEWLTPSYEAEYHQAKHGRLLQNQLYYELKAREAQEDLFADVDHASEVFEYGFGTGKNIALLQHKSGYDVSEFARNFAEQRGIHVFTDMADVPDAGFDVVLSSHVLEHLEDPLSNLKLLGSKLRPGGKLILVLPVEDNRPAAFEIDVDQHLFAWNFRTINNLLQRAGYRILSNRYRYGTGQYKLRHLAKLSFKLYRLGTRTLGRIFNRRDMIIVAAKE